uniref:Uncharacterized protein n=1 Tax=Jaculus jaculus TaxID=51337 RepID=A0A8C5LDQ0_JACJA
VSGAVFLSFVLFLGCWWGVEPYSTLVTKDSNKNSSLISKQLDKDLTQIFAHLQSNGLNNSELASSSNNQEEHLAKIVDHTSKRKRVKESFLFNRDVSQHLTTRVKGKLQGTDSPDAHLGSLPCGQLLHFLQKNIIVAAALVAAIVVVTVYPPANMTYNIFVMDGKSWWQKSQEKCLRKFAEKEKQLNCNSCV